MQPSKTLRCSAVLSNEPCQLLKWPDLTDGNMQRCSWVLLAELHSVFNKNGQLCSTTRGWYQAGWINRNSDAKRQRKILGINKDAKSSMPEGALRTRHVKSNGSLEWKYSWQAKERHTTQQDFCANTPAKYSECARMQLLPYSWVEIFQYQSRRDVWINEPINFLQSTETHLHYMLTRANSR